MIKNAKAIAQLLNANKLKMFLLIYDMRPQKIKSCINIIVSRSLLIMLLPLLKKLIIKSLLGIQVPPVFKSSFVVIIINQI